MNFYNSLLTYIEAEAVEPLEEFGFLRLVPEINEVIVYSFLNEEFFNVHTHFVVGNLSACPWVLRAVNEHHVAGGLLQAFQDILDKLSVIVGHTILYRIH